MDPLVALIQESRWQVSLSVLHNKKSRKSLIIGVIVFVGAIITLGFTLLSGMKDAARAEVDLLRSGQTVAAYQQSSQALQGRMTEDRFILLTRSMNFSDIEDYSFTSIEQVNNEESLSGNVSFNDGSQGAIKVLMRKEGDSWKLFAILVN